MNDFSFEDMKQIKRKNLGSEVPLELFRAIRLIGMYQGLPSGGKGTTMTIGRKIGQSLPVTTVEELLQLLEDLKIGIPHIISSTERSMHIAVEDCFCEGLPAHEGQWSVILKEPLWRGHCLKFTTRE